MLNFNSWKQDFNAGFSVALVALPLSIGIALASGAPASAGIIAALVGGLIGSWLGGGHVTINGPAAGLIVIVLDAIVSLGQGDMSRGFQGMLAASIVAGALQVVFGALKLARKGLMCPGSVIHGMMAAIGLIIIAKQAHVLFGYTPVAKNPIMLFLELPSAVMNLKPWSFLAGALSLTVLWAWPKLEWAFAKKIPAPLIAVTVGVALALIMGFEPKSLLKVPHDVTSWLIFPDFSVMSTWAGWKAALTLALVASLETTLSAAAVEKLDPQHRETNLDRDLISKGVCNMLSGSIGGLPMIAEIVRSSANVSYGAKSWRANFIHGVCILAAVLVLPNVLSLIPLASLAAILVMVGSRLGSPAHLKHAHHIGWDHLSGFVVTMVVTLALDLLVGICAGAMVQYLVAVFMGMKPQHSFHTDHSHTDVGATTSFTVKSALTFCNFESLKNEIIEARHKKVSVELDLVSCSYVDNNVREQLQAFKKSFEEMGLSFKLTLSPFHKALGSDACAGLKRAA